MANCEEWQKKIKLSCETAGTYKPYFDDVIETLAKILENRDAAQKAFEDDGSRPVVERWHGTKVTIAKNPTIHVINELNSQALAYWRDLGLTPKGFKALGESVAPKKKEATFEDLLSDIGI